MVCVSDAQFIAIRFYNRSFRTPSGRYNSSETWSRCDLKSTKLCKKYKRNYIFSSNQYIFTLSELHFSTIRSLRQAGRNRENKYTVTFSFAIVVLGLWLEWLKLNILLCLTEFLYISLIVFVIINCSALLLRPSFFTSTQYSTPSLLGSNFNLELRS